MIIGVIQPDLGAAEEVRHKVAQRKAVLAVILGRVRGRPRHMLEVGIKETAQRGEISAQIAPGAKTQHHELAAAGGEIVVGEPGADRVGLCPVPLVLIKALKRQVVGGADAAVDLVLGQQTLAQIDRRATQLGGVKDVQRAQTAEKKRALAPVDHLFADAQFGRHRADIESAIQIGVQHAQIFLDVVLGLVGQRRAIGVVGLEVVVAGAAHKQTDILVVELDLGQELDLLADRAGAVVQRAVVVVTAVGIAAVAVADDVVAR